MSFSANFKGIIFGGSYPEELKGFDDLKVASVVNLSKMFMEADFVYGGVMNLSNWAQYISQKNLDEMFNAPHIPVF